MLFCFSFYLSILLEKRRRIGNSFFQKKNRPREPMIITRRQTNERTKEKTGTRERVKSILQKNLAGRAVKKSRNKQSTVRKGRHARNTFQRGRRSKEWYLEYIGGH